MLLLNLYQKRKFAGLPGKEWKGIKNKVKPHNMRAKPALFFKSIFPLYFTDPHFKTGIPGFPAFISGNGMFGVFAPVFNSIQILPVRNGYPNSFADTFHA